MADLRAPAPDDPGRKVSALGQFAYGTGRAPPSPISDRDADRDLDPVVVHAFRFESIAELRAAQARIGELRRRAGDSDELWDAVERFLHRGVGTGVLVDDPDERWSVQGVLDYWAAALERAGRARPESSLLEFDPELVPALPDEVCPYRGLAAFEEKDSRVFFGRAALVGKLAARLGEHRLIALVGPSGCGKSSLAFAGLVSWLRRGELPGSESWRIVSMVPGPDPRMELAALDPEAGAGAADPANQPTVLVVDQFEELFTLCRSEPARQAFVAALLARVTAEDGSHRVVLTMRSDFESFVARYPALYELYDAGRVAVTPPSAAELRQAIEEPAALVGLRFEAGVVDRLLQDLLGEPAGLPLLQFTLLRLWQERERNRVTAACYERVGGGRLALARAADALYDQMIPEDQMTARRILLRVGLAIDDQHERTRMRVPRAQFFGSGEDPGRVERVLEHLIDARLLRQTSSRRQAEPQIEVAHEALVRNWPRLAGWLQEAQTGVAQWLHQDAQVAIAEQHRLEAKAAEWVAHGREDRALLDEMTLREAERWRASPEGSKVGASDDLLALIKWSARQLRTTRRRQSAVRTAGAAILVALLAVLSAVAWQYRSAQHARGQVIKSQREYQVATNRLLAMANIGRGRALLIDERPAHPMRALPFLVAARDAGMDSPVLRTLFAHAAHGTPRQVFLGHRAPVTSVAFSPDGTRIISASSDRTARIWAISTGKPLTPPLAHLGDVHTAAFSPDGARVLTASTDGTAQIWDAVTGRPLTPPLVHKPANDLHRDVFDHNGDIRIAAFDRAGRRVVTASDDGTARLWDAATGKPVLPPLDASAGIRAAAFSPDGTRVAAAIHDHVQFWNAVTGQPVPPRLAESFASSIAFSPDGTHLLTTSEQTTTLWDAMTGKIVTRLVHQDTVNMAVFSPDGGRVATASADQTARLWDAVTGESLIPALQHQGAVHAVAFSHDGKQLVTGSTDKTAQIWDAGTGAPTSLPLEHRGAVRAVAFSPDDRSVVTASDDHTLQLWALPREGAESVRLPHGGRVLWAALSPDGTRVFTRGESRFPDVTGAAGQFEFPRPEGPVRVWDASTGKIIHTFPDSEHAQACVLSPDGTRVATLSGGHTVRILDASSGAPSGPPLLHREEVSTVAFSPDGDRVVTAVRDGTAQIWNVATGRPAGSPIRYEQEALVDAVFSPDGFRILIVGVHNSAQVWSASTGRPTTPALLHGDAITVAAFSPDATRVVTASRDRTARIWDAATGDPLMVLEHLCDVSDAAFSPDGRKLVTASCNTAQVWDVATHKPAAPPLEHRDSVVTAAFSPDGAFVVTAGRDDTARVWDAITGDPVTAPLVHAGRVTTARFSKDGMRIVTAAAGEARVWAFPRDERSRDVWHDIARCSPFALVNGVLTANPDPPTVCPPH
ncbi:MAG TPA: hypothetical protein VFK02_33045 [Kofleriaceae bacterium]|nr:hypothetical protein [Kofleriaceae bacterium]